MNLPTDVLAVVKRLEPQLPTNWAVQNIDDLRRAWTKKVAEQVTFRFGPSYGWKSADPGRPPSKDAIAYQAPDGTLWGFDLVSGSTHRVNDPCGGENITGQHFIAVGGVDWLAMGSQPGPAPTPSPTPAPAPAPAPVDLAPLVALLEQIRSALAEQRAAIEALNVATHGERKVSGRIAGYAPFSGTVGGPEPPQ